MKENLGKVEGIANVPEFEKLPVTVMVDSYPFEIEENGNVKLSRPIPEVSHTISPDTQVAEGTPITITIQATITEGTINKITKPDGTAVNNTNETTYQVTENGKYEFTVEGSNGGKTTYAVEISNIIETEKFSDIYTTTRDYTDKNGKTVKIPTGYAVGESKTINTVENGLVITDAIDGNHKSTGNEWVWVPVQDATAMYETANPAIAITGGSSKVVSGVTAGKYSKSGIISGSYGTRVLPNNTSSYREPDVVVSSGTDCDAAESNRKTAGFTKTDGSTMSVSEMAQTMVDEYDAMLASVEKYGGFYIGRYELTVNGEKPGATLTNKDWYGLYAKCKTLAKAGSSTTSRMIWGCQWDVTCNWLANHGDKKNITDSSSWGNYKMTDVKSSDGNTVIKANGTSTKLETGITTFTMANNIYDLAGNCWEWIQEAIYTYFRTLRGGHYGATGSSHPVTNRGYNKPITSYGERSFSPNFVHRVKNLHLL